jgi:hypothetical protein
MSDSAKPVAAGPSEKVERLRLECEKQLVEWWPKLVEKDKYEHHEYNYIYNDDPYIVLSCEFYKKKSDQESDGEIWFYWNVP